MEIVALYCDTSSVTIFFEWCVGACEQEVHHYERRAKARAVSERFLSEGLFIAWQMRRVGHTRVYRCLNGCVCISVWLALWLAGNKTECGKVKRRSVSILTCVCLNVYVPRLRVETMRREFCPKVSWFTGDGAPQCSRRGSSTWKAQRGKGERRDQRAAGGSHVWRQIKCNSKIL